MKSLLTSSTADSTLASVQNTHRHSAMDGKGIDMTRKVKRNRSHRRPSHCLRLENLESRRLLAVAAFESELLADNNGVPGEVISDNTVAAGETFFLRVTAQEFDPMRFGLQSVGVDIAWDASLLDVVEEDFQLDAIITANLPVLQKGTLDQDGGLIEGLSGTSLSALGSGRPIGNAVPETFVLIRMRAGEQPGVATLNLQQGSAKTITAPTAALGERHLNFDHETITIVASASEPETPVETEANSVEPADVPVETPLAVDEEPSTAGDVLPQEPEAANPDTVPEQPVVTEPEKAEPQGDSQDENSSSETVPTQSPAAETPQVDIPVEDSSIVAAPVDESSVAGSEVTESETSEYLPADVPAENVGSAEQVDQVAEAIDEVMSFDFNGDGVFDFADFGLMNVQAASASSEIETVAEDTAATESEEHDVSTEPTAFSEPCIAVPALNDVEATEKWLDDFATAWLADSEARARRREETQLF
ncbi:hypothetical protein FHS27_002818 [Rhodopirellula rubra]|uniref:EF-hand domain-containing protein n=1 Tax=Aporhodopirellula rubra TaxID=980271 RepID=A0A7W5DZE8_9BACT|nr:hypothetical protein [Aporhodopirellula rubra]MBB3207004.1 hypothetical protein [Aporhodopirellula rubra]